MSNRISRWAAGFFLSGMGVLALIAASALVWAIWPEKWRGDGAAAWVQAVGSVAAIIAAIIIARSQHKASIAFADRQAAAATREFVESCLAVVVHAQSLLLKIPGPASNDDDLDVYLYEMKSYRIFEDAVDALKAIPVYRLPTTATVSAVIKLPASIGLAQGIVSNMASLRVNPQNGDWHNEAIRMEDLLVNVSLARQALELFLGRDDELRRIGFPGES